MDYRDVVINTNIYAKYTSFLFVADVTLDLSELIDDLHKTI